jgi:hypothetical protein
MKFSEKTSLRHSSATAKKPQWLARERQRQGEEQSADQGEIWARNFWCPQTAYYKQVKRRLE